MLNKRVLRGTGPNFSLFKLWLDQAQPRRQDVLGDFAGRELCVIHGESLLMHCLVEARVDFQGGFQLLHLVHAVEMFLDKLRSRRCNFNIVWFEDHERLLVPGQRNKDANKDDDVATTPEKHYALSTAFQKRRLARAVLIRHLERYCQQATPPLKLSFRFPSMSSAEFVKYTKQHPVRLFFMTDGQAASICDNMATKRAHNSKSIPQKDGSVMTFFSIIFGLNISGYTVGLLDDIEFKSSEIRASLYSAQQILSAGIPLWEPAPPFSASLDIDKTLLKSHMDFDPINKKTLTSRERMAATALSTILAKDSSHEMKQRAEAFLVHLALLKHCPVSQRPATEYHRESLEAAKLDSQFMNLFCSASTAILASQQVDSGKSTETWDSFDLIDGRIWASILHKTPGLDPTGPVVQSLKVLVSLISGITGIMSWGGAECFEARTISVQNATNTALQLSMHGQESLLPFSQPDFDKLLKDVVVETSSSRIEPPSTFGSKLFKDDSHWHSNKKILALPSRASGQDSHYEEMKRNRAKQRLVTRIHNYAASLTNAVGKVLETETIITTKPDEPGKVPKITKDKRSMPQIRLHGDNEKKRIEDIQRRKESALDNERNEAIAGWRGAYARFQKEHDELKRYILLSDFLQRRSRCWRQAVAPDVILNACCILVPELKALVWRHLQNLQEIPLSNDISQAASMLCRSFGLSIDFSPSTDKTVQCFLSEDIVFATIKALKRDKSLGQSNETEMLLEACGPYMEKGFDSQPDSRVNNFDPDAWQRSVLDVIDQRQSLFVVAPTSAGKTFISFYAMKQVLKESDDGILVYVAPTKALSNQVAADIQARFSKDYPPMKVGKSVWAIHTRDYRINTPTNCQVLVTVPQMLQILLLAPSSSGGPGTGKNPWTSRIKWIIFDEVHSIGLSEEGVIWEQLMLMAPCPIIALSATVGNPYEFKAWVEECEQKKGRELKMVIHSARYSDLRCYFWTPSDDFIFFGVAPATRWPIPGLAPDGYNKDAPFTTMHPVSALVDRSRDTLDDINIESRDCLALWKSMNKHQSDKYRLDSALNPNAYFSGPAIVKAKVVAWEAELKKVLLTWLRNDDSPFLDVRNDLSAPLERDALRGRYGVKRTLQLLNDLQKRDALPALIFLYDREGCKLSVESIVEQLRDFEKQWKATSPVWERTLAAFRKHEKNAQHAQKKASKTTKGSKRGKQDDDDDGGPSSKLDAVRDAASHEGSKWDSFDPDAPLDRFSFANYKKLQKEELEKYIRSLEHVPLEDYIIEGLRRGVAVHHSGMNRGYLQTVEILFRKGFLSAVVATGTLALGINMPCKTVVFSGDSTFLTALNFRQGAGRAGRRGFDLLGNVVFYDFTPQRAKEVMSLRLSDLRGHFPISTSLVLRVATLLNQTNRCAFSQRCLETLFSQTRIYQGGPEGKGAIKHHLRFSIEYLRHHHLLSADGAPIDFAGLVNHLHYNEDAVFALHSLLEGGYFHKLCANIHRKDADVLDTMMLVLSHLFGRILCRRYKDEEWLKTKVFRSSSKVLLPPLPDDAKLILHKHNSGTLSIFRSYVQTYVRQHLSNQPDDTLPFTGQKIAPAIPLTEVFLTSQSPVELRSPFAALSGFTDEFQSIRELCSTVRAGVFLEESSVPYIAIYPEDTDGMPFNAYIYDFFRHGELATIVKANGIKNSDAWYLLQDFSLVLKTIVASIAKFVSPVSATGEDFELDGLFDGEGDLYDDDKEGTGNFVAETEPVASIKAIAVDEKPKVKKQKKAKVLDSWEDASSESEDEGNGSAENNVEGEQSSASSVGDTCESTAPSPDQGLADVHLAFDKLEKEFYEKFRNVWA